MVSRLPSVSESIPHSLPIPRMPDNATWSSAHEVGTVVGKQSSFMEPPFLMLIRRMYDCGSLYPSFASAARIITSVTGGPVKYSESSKGSSQKSSAWFIGESHGLTIVLEGSE